MSVLDKDAYFRKQMYAERKRKEDWDRQLSLAAEGKKALTEEQMEILEKITSYRHDLHSTSAEEIFKIEAQKSESLEYFTNDIEPSYVNNELKEVGLPTIKGLPDYVDDLINSLDYDMAIEEKEEERELKEEERNELYEHYLSKLIEQLGEINSIIEDYLRKIDEEYGTQYCPTGFARLV